MKRRRPFLCCTAKLPLLSLRSGGARKGVISLETRAGFLVSHIKQVQGRVFDRLLQTCGVDEFNGPQGNILYVLWKSEGIPIVELAQKTGLAKNTLTAMLCRMEENGLICRKISASDRRQSIISLTPQARALETRYNQVSQQMNSLFFKDFPGDGSKDLLIAPTWSLQKRHVLNRLHQEMKVRKTYQGRMIPCLQNH